METPSPATRPLAIICNPAAGGGRSERALRQVAEGLRRRGVEHRIGTTRSLADGAEQALAAIDRGELPVVMSGDGLVGHVGGAIARAGSASAMGILPGGRGNDLARALGIPREVDAALGALLGGVERRIDVGLVGERPFLGIASAGYDSVANTIANEARWVRGQAVYLYAALRALATWKPARFRVVADGDEFEFSGYSLVVANSRAYGGGMYVAPEAELDDGMLDLVWTEERSKLSFLRGLPKVFRGEHLGEPGIGFRRAAEVHFDADRPFDVFADGDPLGTLPVTVRLLPQALSVVVPR